MACLMLLMERVRNRATSDNNFYFYIVTINLNLFKAD